jgi:hypothetical protein
MITPKQLH